MLPGHSFRLSNKNVLNKIVIKYYGMARSAQIFPTHMKFCHDFISIAGVNLELGVLIAFRKLACYQWWLVVGGGERRTGKCRVGLANVSCLYGAVKKLKKINCP